MTRVIVIGDVLLDRDVIGRAERLCPDAPVPVIDEQQTVDRLGGAGLAAVLVADHGAEVTMVCALADDLAGRTLNDRFDEHGIDVVDCGDDGSTSEKVRIRADRQSLLRIDRGVPGSIGPLPTAAFALVEQCDALLVSDYGRGITACDDVRRLVRHAIAGGVPTVWDPHPRGASPVPGTTIATPNRTEAKLFDAAHEPADDGLPSDVARACRLRQRWETGAVAMTRGDSGALLVGADRAPLAIPVDTVMSEGDAAPLDVCGAGDALAAAVTVALAAGSVVSEAVEAGVEAASSFVAAGGCAGWAAGTPAPSTTTVPDAMTTMPSPSATPRALRPIDVAAVRPDGGTLVAAGGCFDVLHPGHVLMLERARQLGDRLVVLLNSDASVRRLKGPGRPAQAESDRASVLLSLRCVDDVIVFDDDTPVETLRRVRPDIFVKGGDYGGLDELPETGVMAEVGGTVVTVPYLAGRSTSHILGRIDVRRARRELDVV